MLAIAYSANLIPGKQKLRMTMILIGTPPTRFYAEKIFFVYG